MDQNLQVFIMVVEKRNFSRAARELHMTQPAVSQYIRLLEEQIGTRLLERTNKYVRLNPAGEIVYHHAKEILGLYTNMQHLVDDLVQKASGPLRIGASYTFGEYVLPSVIAHLKEKYTDILPSITIGNTADISQLVDKHQLDIGIVEGDLSQPQLMVKEFAKDKMVVVTHAGDVQLDGNIADRTWIVREEGSGTREATEKLFRLLHIQPKEIITFGSNQSIKKAVEAGLGISLLSQWVVSDGVDNGTLRLMDQKELPFVRSFSIVTKSPFQTKALEVFISLLTSKS